MALKTRILAIILGLLTSTTLQAQSFVRPSNAVLGFDGNIVIQNPSDLNYVKSHLAKFQYVERLKLEGEVDVNVFCELANKFDQLQEIQLKKYQGIISDADLTSMEWIPLIYIYIPRGREDAILLNDYWKRIEHIALEFEDAPEQFDFLKGFKTCKELKIYAPWSASEVQQAVKAIAQYLPKLKELSLSLNKISHLPQEVRLLNQLNRLEIVDNAGLSAGYSVESMSDVMVSVKVGEKRVPYGVGANQTYMVKHLHMPLVYVSMNPEILPSELRHIKKVFPDGEKEDEFDWVDVQQELDFVSRVPLLPLSYSEKFPKSISTVLRPSYLQSTLFATGDADNVFVITDGANYKIMIPNKSLVTMKDEPFHDKFTARVRFMNTPEQLLSYSPDLTYDSAGVTYLLNASAVLDIQFYAGKNLLKLGEGQIINVQLYGKLNSGSRFYAYQENTKKWVHFHEYDYHFSDENVRKVAFNWDHDYNGHLSSYNLNTSEYLSTLDQRFETEGYNYLLNPRVKKAIIVPHVKYMVKQVEKSTTDKVAHLKRGTALIGIKSFSGDIKLGKGYFAIEVYDKTQKLFPELKSLSKVPLVFHSEMDKKSVYLEFLKKYKFFDVRITPFGSGYALELRSSEGLWRIELASPKDWPMNQGKSKQTSKYAKAFESAYNDYKNVRERKEKEWQNVAPLYPIHDLEANQGNSSAAFIIRSTGRFAWACPDTLAKTVHLEIIPSEIGNIPLKTKQLVVVYKKPNSSQIVLPTMSGPNDSRFVCDIDLQALEYVACSDEQNRLFVLTGEQFKKLNVVPNSIQPVAFPEIPDSNLNDAEWLEYFHIKRKKK